VTLYHRVGGVWRLANSLSTSHGPQQVHEYLYLYCEFCVQVAEQYCDIQLHKSSVQEMLITFHQRSQSVALQYSPVFLLPNETCKKSVFEHLQLTTFTNGSKFLTSKHLIPFSIRNNTIKYNYKLITSVINSKTSRTRSITSKWPTFTHHTEGIFNNLTFFHQWVAYIVAGPIPFQKMSCVLHKSFQKTQKVIKTCNLPDGSGNFKNVILIILILKNMFMVLSIVMMWEFTQFTWWMQNCGKWLPTLRPSD